MFHVRSPVTIPPSTTQVGSTSCLSDVIMAIGYRVDIRLKLMAEKEKPRDWEIGFKSTRIV